MPLSKTRDRIRKRRERAEVRLDKLLSPLAERNPVQPKGIIKQPSVLMIDADGNPIYEGD